jgi:hypothetical protein
MNNAVTNTFVLDGERAVCSECGSNHIDGELEAA